MKISLLAGNTSQRGPGKVFQNLKLGLDNLGLESVIHNQIANSNDFYYGYLQDVGPVWQQLDPHKTLFGPNIFVLPSDNKALCNHAKHFVVPSEWVRNLYENFSEMNGKTIQIWSVGIDTKLWKPSLNKSKDLDCFIYFKNRDEAELLAVKKQLDLIGLKYETLTYGQYQEEELERICNRSKFAILLTGTESQGIAYMQILSMNIPCYVFNKTIWTNETFEVSVPGTSVPYFTSECGYATDDLDASKIPMFIEKLNTYKPRNYIEQNHNLLLKAKEYVDILRNLK